MLHWFSIITHPCWHYTPPQCHMHFSCHMRDVRVVRVCDVHQQQIKLTKLLTNVETDKDHTKEKQRVWILILPVPWKPSLEEHPSFIWNMVINVSSHVERWMRPRYLVCIKSLSLDIYITKDLFNMLHFPK